MLLLNNMVHAFRKHSIGTLENVSELEQQQLKIAYIMSNYIMLIDKYL